MGIVSKKSTVEKANVMLAFSRGKQIQVRQSDYTEWKDWVSEGDPFWDWSSNDYQVKPNAIIHRVAGFILKQGCSSNNMPNISFFSEQSMDVSAAKDKWIRVSDYEVIETVIDEVMQGYLTKF